jgi:hypothetical protein
VPLEHLKDERLMGFASVVTEHQSVKNFTQKPYLIINRRENELYELLSFVHEAVVAFVRIVTGNEPVKEVEE